MERGSGTLARIRELLTPSFWREQIRLERENSEKEFLVRKMVREARTNLDPLFRASTPEDDEQANEAITEYVASLRNANPRIMRNLSGSFSDISKKLQKEFEKNGNETFRSASVRYGKLGNAILRDFLTRRD